MNIKIIGGETLGTRSLATLVECSSTKVLIDPGVALGPRFNLLPHPFEYEALYRTRKEIETQAEQADLIFISHYHFDHFTPFWAEIDNVWTFADWKSAKKIYSGREVLLKDPYENINNSQKGRASQFIPNLKKIAKSVRSADSKEYMFGSTKLVVSEPVPHGEEGTPLGYVIMLEIEDKGEKFLFASDIEGPISEKVFEKIVNLKPDILFLSGPPLYLLGSKLSDYNFSRALNNLSKLTSHIDIIILDHHLFRSSEALKYVSELKERADSYGSFIMTISEFNGSTMKMLEAKRKELYEDYPPSKAFME